MLRDLHKHSGHSGHSSMQDHEAEEDVERTWYPDICKSPGGLLVYFMVFDAAVLVLFLTIILLVILFDQIHPGHFMFWKLIELGRIGAVLTGGLPFVLLAIPFVNDMLIHAPETGYDRTGALTPHIDNGRGDATDENDKLLLDTNALARESRQEWQRASRQCELDLAFILHELEDAYEQMSAELPDGAEKEKLRCTYEERVNKAKEFHTAQMRRLDTHIHGEATASP